MALQEIHLSEESCANDSYSSINKLIVFDWDDTLFPRTKILQMCNSDQQKVANISRCRISDVDYTRLNELSCSIHLVLSTFIGKYGARNIRIVSASEKGWIKQSLSIVSNIGRFADVYNLLFDVKDNIEMIHPLKRNLPFASQKQVFVWKYQVFRTLLRDSPLNNECSSTVNTLVSFGDSSHEYKAAKHAASQFDNVLVHRVQLVRKPSLTDMIDQMTFLLNFMMMSDVNQTSDISIDCGTEE
eukprot:192557_1